MCYTGHIYVEELDIPFSWVTCIEFDGCSFGSNSVIRKVSCTRTYLQCRGNFCILYAFFLSFSCCFFNGVFITYIGSVITLFNPEI